MYNKHNSLTSWHEAALNDMINFSSQMKMRNITLSVLILISWVEIVSVNLVLKRETEAIFTKAEMNNECNV